MKASFPEQTKQRSRRLFGRRVGKKMRAGRQELFDNLLPTLKVDVENSAPGQLALGALFDPQVREIWLEIGFGGGEHLISRAEANPRAGFIGCEPFVDGVGKALAEIDRRNIQNIRLYDDDARFLLDVLPDQCVDRAFLLYPDPWPKKRHNKRRFVNDETIAQMARVMKPGGIWLMATDIKDYARWMLAHMTISEEFTWHAECAADWRNAPVDWPGTRYEQKAVKHGRQPTYLTFLRTLENPKIC